jgi:3-dehydroquinate dehydratase
MTTAGNRVEVMHGVNLDQLGRRDPLLYGTLTLAELERQIEGEALELGLATRARSSSICTPSTGRQTRSC